jgi:hypothetical protein
MKKILFTPFLYVLLSCGIVVQGVAQQEGGELKPVEIEIVKEREIALPQANRLFDKIPPRPVEPIKPEITYSFRPLIFKTPEISPSIRPLRLKQEEAANINGGFLSVGYGNYASPMIEAFVNTRQDKNKLLGAHAFFNSSGKGPVDGKNSGSGNSGVSVFAQSFGKEVTFQADAGFENRSTHFYGYPKGAEVSRDTIKQAFDLFKIGMNLANARNTDFSYELGGNFSYIGDSFSARENTIDLTFKSAYKISKDNAIEVKAGYSIFSRKDKGIERKARNLFQVNPYYSFKSNTNLKIKIGAVVAMENDTLDKKDIHFYPDVSVVYPLSPSVDVVGSLSGGIERVSLQSLVHENLWLAQAIPIYHTNKLYDFQAVINARFNSNIFVSSGLSFASLKNLYFFVNDETNQAKFNTVFDEGSTKRTNLFASINMTYSARTKFSMRGDYYGYIPESQQEAWHRPGYKLTVAGSYNIQDKIILTTDIIGMGNIRARNPETLQTIKLNPAFDLNFRAEYFVSKSFSVFLDVNNVIGNSYQVFLNYPVRGFQAMGGITWSF